MRMRRMPTRYDLLLEEEIETAYVQTARTT